ncbi:MAG: hypothetical protein AAB879_03675 [Patescibacteria group bacterium]
MRTLARAFRVASLRSHIISTRRTNVLWLCGDLGFHGLEEVVSVKIIASSPLRGGVFIYENVAA